MILTSEIMASNSPFNNSNDDHPVSACPSETEEAISDEDEEKDTTFLEDPDDHCQCPKSLIALPPLPVSEAVASTSSSSATTSKKSCWRCAGPSTSTASMALCNEHAADITENIDEIVNDHDNFGTDENDDDSLDSSAMSAASVSISICHDDPIPLPSMPARIGGPGGGLKRKSFEVDVTSYGSDLDEANVRDHEYTMKKLKRSSGCKESGNGEEYEICCSASAAASGSASTSEIVVTSVRPSDLSSSSSNSLDAMEAADMAASANQKPEVQLPQEMGSWVDMFSGWSHAQRLLAIDQLIGRCHPTQVRHMMAVIEPQFQRDFISLLPKELALYVLSFLHPRDLLRAAQTCRYWRILAEDNLLWREKCRESGLDDFTEMMNTRRKRVSPGFNYSPWKGGFMRQHNIEINWRVRGIRTPKVLKGHDDHVITCLQFSNNRIVSGSDDNTLKVWHAGTGKCLRTLMGHTGGVWSSQMEGKLLSYLCN